MSQISKLGYVDNKLGAPSSGQQTTRILFNTIEAPGTTSSLTFFKTFQGLTRVRQTLLKIASILWNLWLSKLFGLLNIVQLVFCSPLALVQQTLSIIVGNQTVVKNLPIQFNQGFNGQAFDRLHENAGAQSSSTFVANATSQTQMPVEIRLLTDIVIPPQVAFEVRIDSNAGVYGTGAVVCALSGYGKIFSAGNTF
jgi:hypothetical protein